MASRSRAVQVQLEELEKLSAPFEDQLAEAAKFIGVYFQEDGRLSDNFSEAERLTKVVPYRREEWLMIWLLKKLKAEGTARINPSSWWLLSYIVKILPVRTAARLLTGRDVIVEEKPSKEGKNSILLQTLEDAQKSASPKKDSEPLSKMEKSSKGSKKRKHTGELVETTEQSHSLPNLLEAISEFLAIVIKAGGIISSPASKDIGAAVSAAYMKTVITTTSEKAATILGLWLSLCNLVLPNLPVFSTSEGRDWLAPLIDMWDSRVADEDSLAKFSAHCTKPLLSLLKLLKDGHFLVGIWLPQVERLAAKNIMIPAKAAKMSDVESDFLSTLIKEAVFEDSTNASPLFEIAIRSIQPHGNKRRPTQDNTWLQNVFDSLRKSMSPEASMQNTSSIRAMLESAIQYKVSLELEGLRALTTQLALPDDREDWELLATMITLDANVFLIPNEEVDLLKILLERITKASLEDSWPNQSKLVVSRVLVPLINEFAKARDLSGFISHWYTQLVQFESVRQDERLSSLDHFSAWEDDAVQIELKKLFEPLLTTQQINQIIDWLSGEVSKSPDAVCVILEAIAGAVSSPEIVGQVSLRLYHIMFDDNSSEKLDSRYSWRAWRIVSQTLDWALPSDVDELAKLWNQKAKPFESLSGRGSSDSLLEIYGGNKAALDNLESLRCAGAALSAAEKGSGMDVLVEQIIMKYLKSLKQDLSQFLRDLTVDSNLGDEICGLKYNTLYRGIGWMMWSFVRCVFIEYPKMLSVGLTMGSDSLKDIVWTVLRIASAGFESSIEKLPSWLKSNHDAFSDLWTMSLRCVEALDDKKLTVLMVDAMLSNDTNFSNPLLKSPSNNIFVFRVLNHVPLETLSKADRDQIMRCFLPSKSQDEPVSQLPSKSQLHPAVLALRRRVMESYPNLYEGLEFSTLLELTNSFETEDAPVLRVNLAIIKDLVRLSLAHAHTNLDQIRRRAHVKDAFEIIQKKTRKASDKKKHKLAYGQIAIFSAALHEFHKKSVALDDLTIITKGDLEATTATFKEVIVAQLKDLLHMMRKAKGNTLIQDLYLQIALDTLFALEVHPSDLSNLTKDAQKFLSLKNETKAELGMRLTTFMAIHSDSRVFQDNTESGITTIYGRESIKELAIAEAAGKNRQEKLELLHSFFREKEILRQKDKLLNVKHVIGLIEDVPRISRAEQDDNIENIEEISQSSDFDLTKAYILLCQQLQKSTDIIQFCILSETLELMLKTKPRAISQYAIDLTLGTVSILCSPPAPALPPSRSGTIYLHLCALLRAILTHHRLKLKGHFPLLQLSMQGLLRCLFRPLPHSNINTKSTSAEFSHAPSWLSSPAHQLVVKHAEAYTRLLTLICDPSASSVRGTRHDNLTSATEKWKRMSLLFMRFVLMDYIKWQLEMHMLPEIRERLIPGLYVIFDTTTLETRKLISSELTTSGRAVFGTLYRDYQKFGKWKGS